MSRKPSVFLTFLLILVGTCWETDRLSAQTSNPWAGKPALLLEGFLDVFYAYDFNRPETDFRQPFLFNHNRHNEFNLNLGLLRLSVEHPRYRARLGLQAGTYPNDNYVLEPGLLKAIFEATVGLAITRDGKWWLDAGVLPSHIGFESAISIDNPTLTRSLIAENSPYFLAGAKLTYSPNEALDVAGLVLNGWQRIRRLPGNSLPSFGTHVHFHPGEAFQLNWSSFLGTDEPDSTRKMRYFNNLYAQWEPGPDLTLIGGVDIGFQQRAKGSGAYDYWLGSALILHWGFSPNWKTGIRVEYYQDPGGVIVLTTEPGEFRTFGASVNVDFSPAPFLAFRAEGRWFNNRDPIFEAPEGATSNNAFVVLSIALKYGALLQQGAGPD